MGYARVEALLQAFRLPRWFRSKSWNLRPHKTYIFPTGFGIAFGLLALVQLIMAISSQNNLIYLFVFSEISVALASMFFTNLNIHRIRLASASSSILFAGEDNWISLNLKSKNEKPIYQLFIRWSYRRETQAILPSTYQTQILWRPNRRGYQKLPRLTLESSFPFGMLRAWKIEELNQQVLVYPARKGQPQFPNTSEGERTVQNFGLFYDLRNFQRGDSPRRIDWKASQRSQQMLIRRFEEEALVEMNFNWRQVSHIPNFEDKISQLALWIDRAEKQGSVYSLELANWKSEMGSGLAQWTLCMERLALLSESDLR